jgi:phosphoglycerol transferase MdoB-like AlkP superfamily enzyme
MELNAELPLIGNEYNRVDQFNSKGFIYEFIYVFNSGKIIKPKDYDAKAVEREMRAWEAAGDADAGEKRPHLFLILAEGFSEIPMNPVFSFPSDNPMENYKKLKSEGASGFIVTPSIGGGTADTEFDALTGVSSRNFRGSAYSYSLIVKKMNALPRIMAKAGYFTEAIHPGYPWFYNRSNVLPLLGFENFISSDDFPNAPTKGMYITEEASYERLVEEFENHLASGDDRPYFGFLITIQNHGPYFGKYRDGLTFGFDYDAPFSAKSLNELANYFYGVNDMDDELGKFAEYLQGMSEPAVFAYFGDHLPAIGDEIYDIALEGDELTRLYETPYLVWANDSARPIALDGFADKMSSFFFGASIAESLGVSQKDPFFSFINDLKRSVPIILEDNYFAGDGVSRKNGGGAYDEKVSIYDNWAYYRVFESVD